MATITIDPHLDPATGFRSTSSSSSDPSQIRLTPHQFPALTSAGQQSRSKNNNVKAPSNKMAGPFSELPPFIGAGGDRVEAALSNSLKPTFNPPSAVAIQHSLDLERIDRNTFRSKSLWTPNGARGVFGGQVIGQALNAAGKTIGLADLENGGGGSGSAAGKDRQREAKWGLHSMHCYFLLPADANIPIIYRVERLRDGKSYATRAITATQDATPIFQLSSSFTIAPEYSQPSFSAPVPRGIPGPDDCELEELRWHTYLRSERAKSLGNKAREGLEAYIIERSQSPIAIKEVPRAAMFSSSWGESEDGDSGGDHGKRKMHRNERMLWMKARSDNVSLCDPAFQKCILAYISDFQFVGTAAQSVGLSHASNPKLGMMASLDHSCHFYSDNVDTSKWLLHVISSQRVGEGRGVVDGRFYTLEGELIAVTHQEGVVRAARPAMNGKKADAKL